MIQLYSQIFRLTNDQNFQADKASQRKKTYYLAGMLPAFLILLGFSIWFWFFEKDFWHAGANFLAAIIFAGCIIRIPLADNGQSIYRITLSVIFLLFSFNVASGNYQGADILWVLLYPVIIFFLLGHWEGLAWSLILGITICLMIFIPNVGYVHPYAVSFKIRFMLVYILLCYFSWLLESLRQHFYLQQRAINNRLLESEKRYRLIADNVADIIWKMDMELNFQYISPSIYPMQGWTVQEGMKNRVEDIFTPESLEKIMGLYFDRMNLIESGSVEAYAPLVFEAEQYTKEGSTIWTSIHARVLPKTETEPMHILGITRDITEFKRTRELIVQSEKMMSVGGLAAGMAHEINNPLAGMIQNAELISRRLMDTNLPANVKIAKKLSLDLNVLNAYLEKRDIPKMFKAVKTTGIRMSDIIENMLSFSRKSDAQKSSHSMSGLLDKTIELASTDFSLKKHYDFKSIEIIKEYEKDLPLIPCEAAKIQQVFLNLLNNGAQAMFSAQIENPKFILRTWFDRSEKMICIQIKDNGPGIEGEIKKRIFEPFFTTKRVGDGTGLGLSVSYFIITEDHQGKIEVRSRVGKGTLFTIKLPIGQ